MKLKAKLGIGTAIIAALVTSMPSHANDAHAHRECNAQMLRGLYLFTGAGFNLANGATVPKAIVETIRFNGDGTLVAETVTLTVLGQAPIRRENTPGIYTLEPNCTGTITFADSPAYDTFVSSPWSISMVQTGGPVPAVLVGDARFVSR
ncbi:MAG: hypothetical protein ACJ8MH_09665 [Povalibacter sp.]